LPVSFEFSGMTGIIEEKRRACLQHPGLNINDNIDRIENFPGG
jgi:hypothetical protein